MENGRDAVLDPSPARGSANQVLPLTTLRLATATTVTTKPPLSPPLKPVWWCEPAGAGCTSRVAISPAPSFSPADMAHTTGGVTLLRHKTEHGWVPAGRH